MKSVEIHEIKLNSLLPLVFRGMGGSHRRSSEIWDRKNFVFSRGSRYCIQTESGGGKSSLLSFIYGNRIDYQGTICFNDTDIRTLRTQQWCKIRTENLALLPQEMRLFPELTVMQNIELKNQRTNHKSKSEIEDYLVRLGIIEKKDVAVGKLSIGQQQRVAIIRAICQPFNFIFLDEPVSHLDKINNSIVASIIDEEADKQGAGIITTSVGNNLLLNNISLISL